MVIYSGTSQNQTSGGKNTSPFCKFPNHQIKITPVKSQTLLVSNLKYSCLYQNYRS